MTVTIHGNFYKELGEVWDITSYPDGVVEICTKDKHGENHMIRIEGKDSQDNTLIEIL